MATSVSYPELLAGLALCIILGANNLSACLGASIGAGAIKYWQALALASVGLMTGLLLEGYKLSGAIPSGIVTSANQSFDLAVAISSFILLSVLTYRRIPISLSQVAVGASVGAALGVGLSVNWSFTLLVIFSWLLTPFVGFTVAILLSLLARRLAKGVKRVLALNSLYGYLTIVSGVYAAYVLGANTVGLIVGLAGTAGLQNQFTYLLFGFSTILGMILFSKGTSRSVAENIVGLSPSGAFATQLSGALTVHGFTEFGLPVSVSQAVVGGIYGAALPRRIVLRNDRLTREIVLGWTVAPIVGALLAYAISSVVYVMF